MTGSLSNIAIQNSNTCSFLHHTIYIKVANKKIDKTELKLREISFSDSIKMLSPSLESAICPVHEQNPHWHQNICQA